jgi:hypothetical protein
VGLASGDGPDADCAAGIAGSGSVDGLEAAMLGSFLKSPVDAGVTAAFRPINLNVQYDNDREPKG